MRRSLTHCLFYNYLHISSIGFESLKHIFFCRLFLLAQPQRNYFFPLLPLNRQRDTHDLFLVSYLTKPLLGNFLELPSLSLFTRPAILLRCVC